MEKIDYYDFAENDYKYLKNSYDRGDVGNAMAYIAQNVCERYLKSVIEYAGCTNLCNGDEMKTHSLRKLKKFITKNVLEFCCNWSKVLQADGFYFSARCPGEDSFYVDRSDVDECWEAVSEVKRAVDDLRSKPVKKNSVEYEVEDAKNILKQLNSFQNA